MKKILTVLILFTAVCGAVLFFAGNLVFAGILGGALGVPVKLERIQLGLSKAGIYGLHIGNPAGFKEKELAAIPELSMEYDLSAVFKGKVHVRRIRIGMGAATVEKNQANKINLLELKALKKPEPKNQPAGEKPQETKPQKPSGKPLQIQVQIDEVVLNLDKVRYVDSGSSPSSVKEYDLGIRNETFHDVTNVLNLTKQLVFFILKKVGLSSLTSNFDVLLKGVGGQMGGTIDKWMNKLNNI